MRCILQRYRIKNGAEPEHTGFDLVLELGNLAPAFIRSVNKVGKIPTVAVRYDRDDVVRSTIRLERYFRDLQELFPNRVGVFRFRRTEFVEINLHVKIPVFGRPFTFSRILRIKNRRIILGPSHTSAAES
jgi:hypothetical protein